MTSSIIRCSRPVEKCSIVSFIECIEQISTLLMPNREKLEYQNTVLLSETLRSQESLYQRFPMHAYTVGGRA